MFVCVPKHAHVPTVDYPQTVVLRFEDTFELGRTAVDAAPGEMVRVYDAARTVVDLMRLRHRFGEPVVHTALRRYLDSASARPADLLTFARELGVFGPVRIALDIASAL